MLQYFAVFDVPFCKSGVCNELILKLFKYDQRSSHGTIGVKPEALDYRVQFYNLFCENLGGVKHPKLS